MFFKLYQFKEFEKYKKHIKHLLTTNNLKFTSLFGLLSPSSNSMSDTFFIILS